MNKGIPYLGKIQLYWCDKDNIPLLSDIKCELCGKHGRKVQITPPGDVRPAFKKDIEILQDTISSNYCANLKHFFSSKIILFNQLGGLDRVEEVVLDGEIFGILKYDIYQKRYRFKPRIFAANIILAFQERAKNGKRQILLNKTGKKYILKGKSILAPGVISYTDDIKNGDYCLILSKDGNQKVCISIGKASSNSKEMNKMITNNYGQLAKNLNNFSKLEKRLKDKIRQININSIQNYPINGCFKENNEQKNNLNSTKKRLKFVFEGNKSFIKEKAQKAKDFIKKTIQKQNKPVAVAYSGGKDSLATIKLVYNQIGNKFKIFFVDTGLELPEIKQNVDDVAKSLEMEDKLLVEHAEGRFWEINQDFGPPARDFRYCCHTLKAQNITKIIKEIYQGNKVLTFLGQRRYESIKRAQSKKVYVNSYIPLQVCATPIKSWNSLLLWMYILFIPIKKNNKKMDLPITPLYFQGHDRLGCYLCPASDLATFKLFEKTHPKMIEKWYNYLKNYQSLHKFPKSWFQYGLWRFKKYSGQWEDFLEKHNIKKKFFKSKNEEELKLEITKGFSPCLKSGYSIKGIFKNKPSNEEILNFLVPLVNNINYDEDLDIISINSKFNTKKYRIIIYSDGTFFFQNFDKNFNNITILKFLTNSVQRAKSCNVCKTCLEICQNSAIFIENNKIKIKQEKCTQCFQCITHCPLYHKTKRLITKLKEFM